MEDTIFDQIQEVDLQQTMEESYIDYAMSVIASRALPDARDGLKPVQRRVLYSMIELNNGPDKPHRKCARIVGDTMGKYHPHGDSSIYGALVNMAQPWSTRYPLVDGHGNFGSVDGDGAAAMRYTEARLSKISMEMLADIGKDTVDFIPNFDETEKEPVVLPSRFPNLLVNGTTGIAVGMATNIPPHNLREVITALCRIIGDRIEENGPTPIEDVMDIIKGPDFPTGAMIMGRRGIEEAYRTGRGKIRVRAVTDIETLPNGKSRIIVTELPYLVNKARLIEKIAELVRDKKIDGITGITDESSREGMRISIDIRRDANANVILNQLFRHTQLQDTFGVTMLALDNNKPKVMNLMEMLEIYLRHQEEVVTRRTKYDLNRARERAHILEGLLKALDVIDEVIAIIRGSRTTAEAKEGLMKRFDLSDAQSQAIVDMRLRTLTGLEREKLENEYKELQAKIRELEAILGDEKLLLGVIRDELTAVSEKYGDERKTQFGHDVFDFTTEELIPKETVVITRTRLGYIKRMSEDTFHSQGRGGKGIRGLQTLDEDFIEDILMTGTHQYLMFFTNLGRVYRMKAYQIPEAGRNARGVALINLLQLMPDEKVSAVIPVRRFEEGKYMFMVTRKGLIKKTPLMQYANVRKNGLAAITLRDGDELVSVRVVRDDSDIFLVSRFGQCMRFDLQEVRSIGRTSMGVTGMRLAEGDEVVSLQTDNDGDFLLVVSEKGMGKLVPISAFDNHHRGGKGIKCYNVTERSGQVFTSVILYPDNEIMLINSSGTVIRLCCEEVSIQGRSSSGVRLMNLSDGEKIAGLTRVPEDAKKTENLEEGSEDEDEEFPEEEPEEIEDSGEEADYLEDE